MSFPLGLADKPMERPRQTKATKKSKTKQQNYSSKVKFASVQNGCNTYQTKEETKKPKKGVLCRVITISLWNINSNAQFCVLCLFRELFSWISITQTARSVYYLPHWGKANTY